MTKEELTDGYFCLHGVRNVFHIDTTYENESSISCDYVALLSKQIEKKGLYKLIINTEYYEVTFRNTYGSCGSGYCRATWGDISDIKEVTKITDVHYKPTFAPENMIVFFKCEDRTEDYEGQFDSLHLVLDPDYAILTCSGDGGDSYYPSGSSRFDKRDYFKPTRRCVNKMKVYILTGDSGLGKSFIGNKLNTLSVWESDEFLELPSQLSADIVVLGNKYPDYTVDAIKKLYDPHIEEIDFITVDFKL